MAPISLNWGPILTILGPHCTVQPAHGSSADAGAPIKDFGFGTWLENSLQRQHLGHPGLIVAIFMKTTAKLTQD